jgi:hypothetical protein
METIMGQRVAIMTPSISISICISIQEMNDMNQESSTSYVPNVHEPHEQTAPEEKGRRIPD